MKISSRFTIAVHTLLVIDLFEEQKTTSEFIAGSVGVNPVVIRGILGQLKKAKLILVHSGTGGASLAKKPKEITLKDIFYAVESLDDNVLFGFHKNPNQNCPVGKNIHNILDAKIQNVQNAMNKELSKTTLADLKKSIN
jgi:Rrf2 family protein